MFFSTAGIEAPLWLPPLAAFAISFFTAMGGVSGAFLLLPFQVSVLGYTSPSVSATNQLYNIFAIPSGVYRYYKEKRLVIPLAIITIAGTLPGLFFGVLIRIKFLPEAKPFKLFAATVLFALGLNLLYHIKKTKTPKAEPTNITPIEIIEFNFSHLVYDFGQNRHKVKVMPLALLSLIVGIAGGIYGIGGGAILAPFFVTFFNLPVYTVAGAALAGTFATSVFGVIFFEILARFNPENPIAPDYLLGFLFGIGGMAGMYCGARLQKKVPEKAIKSILCLITLFAATKYLIEFFN